MYFEMYFCALACLLNTLVYFFLVCSLADKYAYNVCNYLMQIKSLLLSVSSNLYIYIRMYYMLLNMFTRFLHVFAHAPLIYHKKRSLGFFMVCCIVY